MVEKKKSRFCKAELLKPHKGVCNKSRTETRGLSEANKGRWVDSED